MPIFRRYVEDLLELVPTVWKRKATNLLTAAIRAGYEAQDAIAEALENYIDTWPIDTAPTWLLDQHWLPMHALQRNGLDDTNARRYVHAKRYLNHSWGAPDQALDIFAILLPTATTAYTYFPPKSWRIDIAGVDLAASDAAVNFMRKRPSPQGGGFSVAGDNGVAVTADALVFSYSSINGPEPSVGFFASVHGSAKSAEAGYAHATGI